MIELARAALFAAGLLIVAWLVDMPYWYYRAMKPMVGLCALLVAFVTYQERPTWRPIYIGAVVIGFVHAFGVMKKHEWVPWNIAGAVFFLVTAWALWQVSRD